MTARWPAGLAGPLAGPPIAARAAGSVRWPDTPAAMEAAKARIAQLQSQLTSQPSATMVLTRWCATYRLAAEPRISANRIAGPPKPVPFGVRQNLALTPGEAIGYRRVQLLCGDRVLSDAENWYVPDRLTPAMNELLDNTDTPFGLALHGLRFSRRTLSSEALWAPPAQAASGSMMTFPDHLLRIGGLLTIVGGLPVSQVIENYTAEILGIPP